MAGAQTHLAGTHKLGLVDRQVAAKIFRKTIHDVASFLVFCPLLPGDRDFGLVSTGNER